MRSALRSIRLRLLLAALLLFAQQGALTHALSHAGRQAHGLSGWIMPVAGGTQYHAGDDPHAPADSRVDNACAFDLAYSQVLGGVHAGHDIHAAVARPAATGVAAVRPWPVATVLSYRSRAPPVIS